MMKEIVLLNGSPRVKGSTSMKMLDLLNNQLGAGSQVTITKNG